MLVTHNREKLIQAINYFVRNTRKTGKVKLFKLLYLLDFEHLKLTGRTVTGLTYNAWPMGPVPVSLFNEIESPPEDLSRAFDISTRPIWNGGEMLVVSPKLDFVEDHFSRRELSLLDTLARKYRDSDADQMIEATHLENAPWDTVYNKRGERQGVIPIDLAFRADERDEMIKIAQARKELLEKLG